MLSRAGQLSRLGLTAARASRPAVAPVPRARATAAPLSPWIRTYADKKKFQNRNKAASKSDSASKPSEDGQGGKAAQEADSKSTEAQEEEPIPFHKLPDLTQGIPSTWEAEHEKQTSETASALQHIEQEQRGRDREDRYVPTSERNRQWWVRFLLASTLLGSGFGVVYLGRGWEDEVDKSRHPDIPNGWSPSLWWQRVRARLSDNVSYYQDPAFDKLLPDPDPSFERPYTLCISLEDMLVHSEWSREHGWRVAKRPGVDYFIRYLSQYYELVMFTTVPFGTGEPLLRKIDPFGLIMWPLCREATKFEDGEIVKDLSYLNRDLSKVIMVDTNAKHIRKQPENAIIINPWKGDPNDKELIALIPFLEYIHTMQYEDVRKVMKSFEGKHIPTEFARREAIARKEFNAQLAQRKHSKPSGVGALGSMLGLKPSNMSMMVSPDGEPNPTEAFAQGKMLQDIARERGQRNYEALEKQIRENGEMWLKEQAAAMEKAQQEAMANMMGGGGWFGGAKKEEPKS